MLAFSFKDIKDLKEVQLFLFKPSFLNQINFISYKLLISIFKLRVCNIVMIKLLQIKFIICYSLKIFQEYMKKL